jgi:hypothetical protein
MDEYDVIEGRSNCRCGVNEHTAPTVLAVTASLGTGQEFRSYPRRIDLGNVMVMRLNELKLWWMSLSMYQKQLPHNKDKLVMSVRYRLVHPILLVKINRLNKLW